MMTEKPQPLSTQSAIPSQTLFAPSSIPVPTHDVPKAETVEEEPYTIKCICEFSDDDGNTIYCETCDTWQHIECFYPNNRDEALRAEFSHSCAECKPRPLDRARAIERTRQLKGVPLQQEAADRKAKRPPPKSQKKTKPKPNELQLNGNHVAHDGPKHGSPNDHHQQPPAKKAKTSHRPSQSTSSQAPKRSPSYGASRTNHTHPPSPATTPPDLPDNFEIHAYSDGFCSLYDEGQAQIVQSNSFDTILALNTMSVWIREPDLMKSETDRTYEEVFEDFPADAVVKNTLVHVDEKSSSVPGATLRWRFLKTHGPVDKDTPLLELNGKIGLQKDYSADRDNMWTDLSCPLPFVFFHPHLPLYIDTRKEGSEARYVRRSCKPNSQLGTTLSGNTYQFWLVSDRYIAPHEQITLPWDFRLPKQVESRWLHLLGLGDGESSGAGEPDIKEEEYATISDWIHRILSEYGGCACDLGSNCAFARFHRHYLHGRALSKGAPKKKSRKTKGQAISPTSTGQATNSRAASEGHLDDGPDNDGRSTLDSGSKPPSRDLTPMRQGSLDMTDREKRKIQMAEDAFRKIDQPPRKKKRTSDGATGASAPKPKAAKTSSAATNGGSHYVDAATSRSKSGSPASAPSPTVREPTPRPIPARPRQASGAPRPNYVDAAVQTDAVEGEWFSASAGRHAPKPKKRIVSLSKRLLNNRLQVKLEEEERRRSLNSTERQSIGSAPDADSAADAADDKKSPTVPVPGSLTIGASVADRLSLSPSASAAGVAPNDTAPTSPLKTKSPGLQVVMPPVPSFGQPSPGMASTPLSTSLPVQSPFSVSNLPSPFPLAAINGGGANPSPVKKKLSLSDYTRRSKAGKVAGISTSTKSEDGRPASGVDAIVESPATEKAADGP